MKEVKLKEDVKKSLNKVNKYIEAVFDKEIIWSCRIEESHYPRVDDIEGPTAGVYAGRYSSPKDFEAIENEIGYKFLNSFVDENIFSDYDDMMNIINGYDGWGNGDVYITYDAKTQIFKKELNVFYKESDTFEHMKTFDEWANEDPTWGRNYHKEKLENKEFVNKMKDYLPNGKISVDYSGGGDDGYIEGDIPIALEDLGYAIIGIYFSGWENNEGADGTINFDFNQKTIGIKHIQYYEADELISIGEYILS